MDRASFISTIVDDFFSVVGSQIADVFRNQRSEARDAPKLTVKFR
jgi:hypothetical protein